MIKINNLSKIYSIGNSNEVVALNNISIDFPEKGLVFVLGKSGSGKSTLLNILGGLDKPTSGELIIDNLSTKEFKNDDYDSYRNTYVGFVFQEYNLLEDLDVKNNILIASNLQKKNVTEEELDNVLNSVEILDLKNRKIQELSGGQKQRVAIARALIKNPELILADEPTGALDSETGKQIFDILKNISKEKLVIVVSHDKDAAKEYADQIVELKDGAIKKNTVKNKIDDNLTKNKKIEKSNLPFINALKIGLSTIKKRKTKFIFTCLLTSISLGMFGFSLSLMFFDDAYPIEQALKSSDIETVVSGKKITNRSEIYTFDEKGNNFNLLSSTSEDKLTLLDEDDINELNKNNLDFVGIFTFEDPKYLVSFGSDCYESSGYYIEETLRPYFGYSFSLLGFSDCGEDYCNKNFELIAGNYPTTANGIAISSYSADYLLNSRLSNGDDLYNNYEDIIGKSINLESSDSIGSSIDLTVTGIYDVGSIPNKYKELLTEKGRYDVKLIKDFTIYIKNSFNKIGFVSQDFYSNWCNIYDYDKEKVNSLTIDSISSEINTFETRDKVSFKNGYSLEIANMHIKDLDLYSNSNQKIKDLTLNDDEIYVSKDLYNDIIFSKYNALLSDIEEIGSRSTYLDSETTLKNYSKEAYDLFQASDYIDTVNNYKLELKNCVGKEPSEMLISNYDKINNLINNWYDILSNRRHAYLSFSEFESLNRQNNQLFDAICNNLDDNFKNSRDHIINDIFNTYPDAKDISESDFADLTNFIKTYYDITVGEYNCINQIESMLYIRLDTSVENFDIIKDNLTYLDNKYSSGISRNYINGAISEEDAKLICDTVRLYYKNTEDISDYSFVNLVARKVYNSTMSYRFTNDEEQREVKIVGYYNNGAYKSAILNNKIINDFDIKFNNSEPFEDNVSDYTFNGKGKYVCAFSNKTLTKDDIKNIQMKKDTYSILLVDDLSTNVKEVTSTINSFVTGFTILGSIFAVFAGLLMFTFINNSISDKKRDIGILRAIGSRSKDIFKIFAFETALICIVSIIVGIVITSLGIVLMNYLTMSNLYIVIVELSIQIVLLELLLVLVVSLLSVSYPITKICKKNPIDCIRE